MTLPEKIVALHQALQSAGLPHAFGGALALAWCTQRARGTIDIDINIFVGINECEAVFAALPKTVSHSDKDLQQLRKEGQVRLWWEQTPLDVFLNTTDYHAQVAQRTRWEQFGGLSVPFLACRDVAIFKAFFNRTKDWADIEAMMAAGTLQINEVTAVLIEYLGVEDERIAQLEKIRHIAFDE